MRWLALFLLIVSPWLAAHQQKEAITRVLFNPRTGNIEVMHRFLLHDAEHAARKVLDEEADILGSEETRQAFADYVYGHFTLMDQNGEVLDLKPLGQEIEGPYIWVYQETEIPGDLTSLKISHDALRDIWPEQYNLVNVERDGKTQSAAFQGGSREVIIDFEP